MIQGHLLLFFSRRGGNGVYCKIIVPFYTRIRKLITLIITQVLRFFYSLKLFHFVGLTGRESGIFIEFRIVWIRYSMWSMHSFDETLM